MAPGLPGYDVDASRTPSIDARRWARFPDCRAVDPRSFRSSRLMSPAISDLRTPASSRFTDAERDALLAEHLKLVHHLARRLSRRLSTSTDVDELVSAGTLGLMQALEAFDASRGRAFSTFAAPRIRGAMLDELRRQDHAPRRARHRARAIGVARRALAQASGHAPSDADVARHLGIDLTTFGRWQRVAAGVDHAPIDAPASAFPELVTSETDGADAALLREERVRVLRDAIHTLREQQRLVLALYYFEELPIAQIAPVLGVTESRVSQIHRKALRSLRATLHEAFDVPVGRAA